MKALAFFFALMVPMVAVEPLKVAAVTVKAREYKQATITNLDGIIARVAHADGAARIPIELFPDDIRAKLGYDEASGKARTEAAAKAAAGVAEQNRLRENFPVRIECIAVKMIEGKYRWFFRIKNPHANAFTDSLKITMLNRTPPYTNGSETFQCKEGGIFPGGAAVVYFDTYGGPASVHADFCVEKFKCEPMVNGTLTGRSVTDLVPGELTDL